jgi:heptosyltransferase-1
VTNTESHAPAIFAPRASAESILLVLVAGIGDFVMATPAIRSIRHGFPSARLMLLTTPQAGDLARACPFLDEVGTFDLRAYRPRGQGLGWGAWRRFLALTAELRARRFDLAVNLYHIAGLGGAVRMGAFFALVRARSTAGRWSRGFCAFYGMRSRDHTHQVDAMLALAASLGCPVDESVPELWIPQASRRSAAQRLLEVGVQAEDSFAVLNFSSNRPEARLPQSRAVEIGCGIHQAAGLPVVLVGDSAEAEIAQALSAAIGPGSRTLAGRMDLLELAAILSRAKIVLSTDSGPMHIAAAVGAPLVALFGPADPAHTGPRGRTGAVSILQGKDWPRAPKKWHIGLGTDEVIRAALHLLDAPSLTKTV